MQYLFIFQKLLQVWLFQFFLAVKYSSARLFVLFYLFIFNSLGHVSGNVKYSAFRMQSSWSYRQKAFILFIVFLQCQEMVHSSTIKLLFQYTKSFDFFFFFYAPQEKEDDFKQQMRKAERSSKQTNKKSDQHD